VDVLIGHATGLPLQVKFLAIEEPLLAGWITGNLHPHVTNLAVCDSLYNALRIAAATRMTTRMPANTSGFRLGKLTPTNHTYQEHGVDFKIAAQQYLAVRCNHASLRKMNQFHNNPPVFHIMASHIVSSARY
jgi:hypothetical protein